MNTSAAQEKLGTSNGTQINQETYRQQQTQVLKIAEMLLNPVYCVSAYLVYLLCRQIALVSDYLVAVQYPLVVWAYILIVYFLIKDFSFFKVKWLKVFFLLLPAAALTLIVNFAVNPSTQIKSAILLGISILLIYPLGAHIARSKHSYRELAKVLLPAQIVTMLQAFTSLVMIAAGFTFLDEINGVNRALGVQSFTYDTGNRVFIVFGMNIDSNHAALFGIISLFVTTWALLYREKIFHSLSGQKLYKVFYWVNTLLLVLAIPAANSRGSRIALFTTLLVIVLWLFIYYYRHVDFLRTHSKVFLAFWVALFCGVGYLTINAAMDAVITGEIGAYSQVFTRSHQEKNTSNQKMVEDVNLLQLDKGDATKSVRIYIWQETIDLWQNHKLVGVGPFNTQDYAKAEHLPSELKMLERGTHVHNSYLDVLISYGALGFGIYVVFFLGYACSFVKRIRTFGADWCDLLLTGAMLTIMAGVMFLTDSFLGLDYMFALLLICMGFLVSRTRVEKMYLPVVCMREVKLKK